MDWSRIKAPIYTEEWRILTLLQQFFRDGSAKSRRDEVLLQPVTTCGSVEVFTWSQVLSNSTWRRKFFYRSQCVTSAGGSAAAQRQRQRQREVCLIAQTDSGPLGGCYLP